MGLSSPPPLALLPASPGSGGVGNDSASGESMAKASAERTRKPSVRGGKAKDAVRTEGEVLALGNAPLPPSLPVGGGGDGSGNPTLLFGSASSRTAGHRNEPTGARPQYFWRGSPRALVMKLRASLIERPFRGWWLLLELEPGAEAFPPSSPWLPSACATATPPAAAAASASNALPEAMVDAEPF